MRLILDTNVLIAALMKDSLTREILLFPGFELLLPEYALEEITKHRTKIARHARLRGEEIDLLLTILLESISVVPKEEIRSHMQAAEELIGGVDPNDVPFVALALARENDGIWSNDQAFDGIPGIRRWTTADIKAYLHL